MWCSSRLPLTVAQAQPPDSNVNLPGTQGEPTDGSPVPTCFRHPGRETYVSCVRCGRHACPDCLRAAPVGQQCVECVREGSRDAPRARTVFGGRIAVGARVTWLLVAVDVIIFREWYRLITSAFLHSTSPLHILFNMWALVVIGPSLEQALGRLRFIAVYLMSALGGSVLFYLVGPPTEAALGASGAIFGLFGAWFIVARRLRLDARGIVVLIAINLVISFTIPFIAWQAHVGGLITGAALTAAYAYAPRDRRLPVQAGATIVILAVLILATVVRTHQLVA